MAAHSVQSALSTRDCRWPGCPDDGIHDEPGGPLCERHWRLQTTGSPLPPPARCDECRALLTGAHSEACSRYVEIRKPPSKEALVSDTLTRCKRVGCTEAATEHSLGVRSNRYRQLCQAHYDAERAKSARPQTNGAPVALDPDPPIDPPDAPAEPTITTVSAAPCGKRDPHDAHEWIEDDDPRVGVSTMYHCNGAGDRQRALRPAPEPGPIGEPYEGTTEGVLVTTLEESGEWTPASRIRSAYVSAIEDGFSALGQELTSGETHYSPGPLLDAIGNLLDLAGKVEVAISAVTADEVPSAG